MPIVLENAILVDLDPLKAETGGLRIEGGSIAARGQIVSRETSDEVVDCGGVVVLPGLVNGHTHLYSALAVGMPPPAKPPTNFPENLQRVWWRLDQALDAESIEMSARIGALEALRCGTTTLIDHHASPRSIEGSLDRVQKGIADVGLRGVLCYETTDRHGKADREAGLAENSRFLEAVQAGQNGRFAGLVGAHAAFTLEDETLARLGTLAEKHDRGVHIHVAEDPCDEADAIRRGSKLIDRLAGNGLLRPDSIFAHGTHLSPDAITRVREAGVTMAHNARSNMNNGVGYSPVESLKSLMVLGTDGIGSDMFAEAKTAWYISRHEHAGLTPADVLGLLAASARRASKDLGITLGRLQLGAAADVVITDYVPFTPLTSDNIVGHFLFAMGPHRVADVMIDGRWAMRRRTVTTLDEPNVRREAVQIASGLWERMGRID